MTKVILIAVVSLLAVVHAAGWPLLSATMLTLRAALASDGGFAVQAGGFAVQEVKAFLPASAHNRAAAPPFASLVSVNRLESVQRPLGGPLALALAEREAGASWSAAAKPGLNTNRADSEWRWDRVAVLTAASAVAQPRRPQSRCARGRRFWPLRRPSYGARVWLTRKQP